VAGDDRRNRRAWQNWPRMQRRSARLVGWHRREAPGALLRDMEIVEQLVYTLLWSSAEARSARCWGRNEFLVVISEVIASK